MKFSNIIIGTFSLLTLAYACTKTELPEEQIIPLEIGTTERGLCGFGIKSADASMLFTICGPNAGNSSCLVCNQPSAAINSASAPTNAANYSLNSGNTFGIVNVSAFPIRVVVGSNTILTPPQTIQIPVGQSAKVTVNNNCSFVLGPC